MAEQKQIGFKTVQLLKDQTLGVGSYGKVCKAKCDDLLCAAKLIHETLFDPTAQQLIAPQREHRLPMRRFEQECEFLSTVRHPNIVQYLGIYRDPDTGLPALLMELMDDSLTHFLESSPQPIPYHIQVNICHDVIRALSFLHSNDIIHRDLSSNNVLLIGNVRAKVTDFGMARLGDQNPRATQLTFTMCPGTDVYMPPEAVQDKPVYTEKIDCFSFGVIIIQILTREFPEPGDRRKRIQINQPGLPLIVEVPISEIERRQDHIGEIDPNHTLLQVALDCLKDEDVQRPSAQQLCERVAALKEDPQCSESVRMVEASITEELKGSGERDRGRELRSLGQQHSQQIQGLQQIIQSQSSRLVEKDQIIARKDQTIVQKDQALREKDETITELTQQEREKDEAIAEKVGEINRLEGQLGRVNQQLEESEQVNAQFQIRIAELEQLRLANSTRIRIKLTWMEGEKAPRKMGGSFSNNAAAAVDGRILYVAASHQVYAHTIGTSSWSQLPDSPTNSCPLVIINNLLTCVGGNHSGTTYNQLFSLTGKGSRREWTEEFPPMSIKRYGSTALCTGTALIVAGGNESYSNPKTIEVMNTATKQWTTALSDLPQPLAYAYNEAAICGDHIYILRRSYNVMYTCSIRSLVQPSQARTQGGFGGFERTPPAWLLRSTRELHYSLYTYSNDR